MYKSGTELYSKFLKGSNLLKDVVTSTLGPKGRTVIVKSKTTRPMITKDGVSVARFVNSEDIFEQMAIDVIRQAAEKTVQECGDGTTTTILLSNLLLEECVKLLSAGFEMRQIRENLEMCYEEIEKLIHKHSRKISNMEEIENIARISANGDSHIAKLIKDSIEQVGRYGTISIVESKSNITTMEILEGFKFDSGIINDVFVNSDKGLTKFQNAFILITDYKINKIEPLLPLLEKIDRSGQPLIIVAEDFGGEAIDAFIYSVSQNRFPVCCVKPPRYGEERKKILEDLAICSNAKFFKKEMKEKLEEVELSDLGICKNFESSKMMTTFVGLKSDATKVSERVEEIRSQIKSEEDMEVCKTLQERVSRILGCASIIHVGGNTEVEMLERKHRVEDSLEAAISAQNEGIVDGAGFTLFKVSKQLKNKSFLRNTMIKLLLEPLRKLCELSHLDFKEVQSKYHRNKIYDFQNDKFLKIEDSNIFDPLQVQISCLKNSILTVSTLITTSNAIGILDEV